MAVVQVFYINAPRYRGGRTWWDKVGQEIVNIEFAKMVDEMLAKNLENATWEVLGNWDQGLSKN